MPADVLAPGDLNAVELVSELHARLADMYSGGSLEPVAELLPADVVWHVGGYGPLAGSHRGIRRVLTYFEARRRMTEQTIRLRRGRLISGGEPVIQIIRGSAELAGKPVTCRSVGIYRVDLEQRWIREAWLHPLD
jgi:hypothetical protein